MNKAFKVLWNQVRGSYVVASENQVTHGKPGKATKTIVAAAVAGLMAMGGVASAAEINVDFEYVTKDQGTTKFISGDGNTLNIQTSADAQQMIKDIKNALSADSNGAKLKEILAAISQVDTGKQTAILTGTTGGTSTIDGGLQGIFALADLFKDSEQFKEHPEIARVIEVLNKQLDSIQISEEGVSNVQDVRTGGTKIVIGGEGSEPVLLATVGADRVVNTGSNILLNEAVTDTYNGFETDTVRQGNVEIVASSGNLLVLTGASSAVNVNGLTGSVTQSLGEFLGHPISITAGLQTSATSTSTTIQGNVNVSLDGHVNAAGVLLSGSAIALGGEANTKVTGNSTLNISSSHDDKNKLSGVTVGVFGGGLAASTLNGTSTATTEGTTTVNITDGVSVGIFGSGAALSAELEGKIWNTLQGLNSDSINIDLIGTDEEKAELLANGGSVTVTSQGDINVVAGGKSVTVGVAGGGLAVTSSGGKGGTSEAHVNTGNITLTLGDANTPALSEKAKLDLQDTAGSLISSIRPVLSKLTSGLNSDSLGSIFDLVTPVSDAVNAAQENYQGAHVGNVGGSLVIARMPSGHEGTKAISEAMSGDITVNLNGGYTVTTLGGGMTIAMGEGQAEGTHATSDVKSTTVNINGGDNVLVMAGGAAYATGNGGQGSKVISRSDVESSTINVNGGSVDGLFGAGMAIDDTGASSANALATTETVTINVNGGTVNAADTSPLVKMATGLSEGAPSNGTYVHDTADLLGKNQGQVAILGGGIASGAQATVHSDDVKMDLAGGTVNGNVYAGGAATLGGQSTVTNAVITLNGATVDGDIYGGGLVGSKRNNNFANADTYDKASSTVENVTIELNSGSVKNVYVGGYTYEGSQGVTNNVENAIVKLGAANVFQGETLDGSAAKSAVLEIAPTAYAFADGQKVVDFNSITASGSVSGLIYEFGQKEKTTVTGGSIDFAGIAYTAGENTLAIGDDQTAGVASVAVKNLQPQYETASLTRAGSQADFTFDVNNGLLSLNADSATAQKALATASSQAKAAAYVTGETDLTNIAVLVGNTEATEAGLHLGSDGMLVADAGSKTTEVTGTADTAQGTIHFVGVAEDSAKVTIAADDETATSVDNMLFKAVKNDNVYTFAQRSGDELAEVGLGDFDDPDFLADLTNHDTDGANYIAGFLDQSNTGVTNANRTQQLNAAVNLATAAGVQTAAIDSATMGLDAANKRASLIHEFTDGGVLFAEASGRRTEMGGSADFGEIKAELGGVVLGGEYTTGDWTFGALANVGTGSVKGQGKNEGVDNDVDYYGGQLYAAKRFGQFNVVGQLGYLATSNEISHSTVAMNKADVDADVIMAGVRGEMRFDLTENSRLVPYVGLNYMRVGTDGYTTSQGVKVGSVDQNLFTVPVGVKYAGDMKTASGWTWTPSADVGYVAAFGDRDVEATTHVGAVGKTTMDVWAESVVRTSIGVKAVKDNFGLGVEAGGVMGSDDTTGVFGQIRVDYRF